MEISIQSNIRMELHTCINCGIHFALPAMLDNQLRQNHNNFFCPHGHPQHYGGESEAEKLRRELRRKEQELADQVQAKLKAQNNLIAAERKLKRVQNGVCTCCNRSFKDLKRHMETKHPELMKTKTKN